MSKIAVFPGSFDPITIGHQDLVRRAAAMYDEVIVAVGINSTKTGFFPMAKRLAWLEVAFDDLANVRVESYHGLTVDFCKTAGARVMLRGVRNGRDFDYEMAIAQMSRDLNPNIETVLMLANPAYSHINSSIVREIIKNKGDVSAFISHKIDVYED
jgi:pantetheine-phosphate adenylyltransferase